MKRKYPFRENSYDRLLPREESQQEVKRVKHEVRLLCLRDLKKFTGIHLQLLYKNRFKFECKESLLARYVIDDLDGETVVKILSETLSGKQHVIDEHDKKLLRDKLPKSFYEKGQEEVANWILDKLSYWNYPEWEKDY